MLSRRFLTFSPPLRSRKKHSGWPGLFVPSLSNAHLYAGSASILHPYLCRPLLHRTRSRLVCALHVDGGGNSYPGQLVGRRWVMERYVMLKIISPGWLWRRLTWREAAQVFTSYWFVSSSIPKVSSPSFKNCIVLALSPLYSHFPLPHCIYQTLSLYVPFCQPPGINSQNNQNQPGSNQLISPSFSHSILIDDPYTALYLLPFAVQTFVTTLTCISEMLSWPLSSAQKLALASLYVPYWFLGEFFSFILLFYPSIVQENKNDWLMDRIR